MLRGKIETESTLGYKMMAETVGDQKIKQALREISAVLMTHVLTPIRQALNTVTQVSDLPKPLQTLVAHEAEEHSAEKHQYGAVVPDPW